MMTVKERLIADLYAELKSVDFNDDEACDDSYDLMLDQIHIQIAGRSCGDQSLTERDEDFLIAYLEAIGEDLKSAYVSMLKYLEIYGNI